MQYEGHAFHQSLKNGKASGTIAVSREGVAFRNETTEMIFPLSGLKFELGGASNRLIFISNNTQPEWKFYTADHAILKDPVIGHNISLKNEIGGIKKTKNFAVIITLLIVGIIALSLWGIWSLKDVAVEKAANQVPAEWEQKLGEVAFTAFKTGQKFITDEPLQKDLEKMLEPLLKVAQNENYKYQFHIIEDSSLNAAAFPGGHVIIHTGLLLKVEKPEEILGVLAHEIAHVNQRHSVRQLINTAGLYLALSAVVGDIGAISGVILDGGSQLLVLQNSRAHETDADETGWEYLMQAKINPRGLIDCFKIMQKEMEALTGTLPPGMDFLSTHPALEARIAYLEEKWQKLENKEQFINIDVDYTAFKNKLREVLNSTKAQEGEANPSATENKSPEENPKNQETNSESKEQK